MSWNRWQLKGKAVILPWISKFSSHS